MLIIWKEPSIDNFASTAEFTTSFANSPYIIIPVVDRSSAKTLEFQ